MDSYPKFDSNAVLDYFDKPDYYSKIVLNNYMYHQEFFGMLKQFLTAKYSKRQFSILDIGCNDAFMMSEVLKDTNIEAYCGVDLSQLSLELAKQNLSKINCDKSFICANYLEKFNNSDQKFDLIWTSFMMHHLSLDEKATFIKISKKLLKPGGSLILVDQINDYNSRTEFIDAVNEHVFKKWTKISNEELKKCMEHCYQCDFPEKEEKLRNLFKDNGFDKLEVKFKEYFWGYMQAS